MVRRGPSGGTDLKVIKSGPGQRRVTWIHWNAADDEIGREDDPTDAFDPRTRPWYVGAAATDAVSPGTIRLTVGAQFPASDYITHPGSGGDGTATGQVTTVAATGTGTRAPAPTDLSQMSAADIPCVK